MAEDRQSEQNTHQKTLGNALVDMIYGGWDQFEDSIKKSLFEDMNKHLLSVFGLVSFKLVTQLMAKDATQLLHSDPEVSDSDLIYRTRQIKENIRGRVINEWKRIGPEEALRKAKQRLGESLPDGAIPDTVLERLVQEAVQDIDVWARQALDMTPTAEELMESLVEDQNAAESAGEPQEWSSESPNDGGE